MKQKFIDLYMDFARRVAKLSHAKRLKVGAVIVKDDTVISYGYNGTPAGWDNNCEYEIPETYTSFEGTIDQKKLVTKPEVLHAERNALDKLAKRGGVGGDNAVIFVTHSPCLECAKSIYVTGIKSVYYEENYRSEDGIEFLKKCGVNVEKINIKV